MSFELFSAGCRSDIGCFRSFRGRFEGIQRVLGGLFQRYHMFDSNNQKSQTFTFNLPVRVQPLFLFCHINGYSAINQNGMKAAANTAELSPSHLRRRRPEKKADYLFKPDEKKRISFLEVNQPTSQTTTTTIASDIDVDGADYGSDAAGLIPTCCVCERRRHGYGGRQSNSSPIWAAPSTRFEMMLLIMY